MISTHITSRPIAQFTWATPGLLLFILSAATLRADDFMHEPTQRAGAPTHTVYFDFGADRMTAAELTRLDTVIEKLKRSTRPLLIRGFTDAIGFQAYNDELAQRRADNVRTALMQRGIPASRLKASGVGRSDYIADNAREPMRKLTRRVEIRFEERRLHVVETGPRRRDGDSPISRIGDSRRVGRYSQLSTVPSPGQADPLQTVISVTFPQDIVTIGAALHHVLVRSGWQIASHEASDPTFASLAALMLPAAQRTLGPITLIDALAVLCGEAYTIVVDPVHRLIACELRETYAHLVRVDNDLVPAKDASEGDEPDGQH